MPKDQAFNDYIVNDVLKDIPGITSKSMFGGWSLYLDGVIFGMIIDGELYFKVSEESKKDFDNRGSRPFTYQGKHKAVTMSYWTLPEEILENKQELTRWIERSTKVKSKNK